MIDVISNVPDGRLVPSSSGRSVCQRVAGMDTRSGYVFCEPEGWQGWEIRIVGRGEEQRAKIERQQFRHIGAFE